MTVNSTRNSQIDTSNNTLNQFSFGKDLRLLQASDYSSVFDDAPIRASHPKFLILARVNSYDHPRLGLVIAKKHIKLAVGRNRVKRVVRNTFRLQQHKLPSIDAIVLARQGAANIPDNELTSIFNGLWKRIIKRAKSLPTKT